MDTVPTSRLVNKGRTMNKGSWAPWEDEKLLEFVRQYSASDWNRVQALTGLPRCGKSCRLRWRNELRPGVCKDPLTAAEKITIIERYRKIGSRWSKIAEELPGRTDNTIKNFVNSNRKKLERLSSARPSRVQLPRRLRRPDESAPVLPSFTPMHGFRGGSEFNGFPLVVNASSSHGWLRRPAIPCHLPSENQSPVFSETIPQSFQNLSQVVSQTLSQPPSTGLPSAGFTRMAPASWLSPAPAFNPICPQESAQKSELGNFPGAFAALSLPFLQEQSQHLKNAHALPLSGLLPGSQIQPLAPTSSIFPTQEKPFVATSSVLITQEKPGLFASFAAPTTQEKPFAATSSVLITQEKPRPSASFIAPNNDFFLDAVIGQKLAQSQVGSSTESPSTDSRHLEYLALLAGQPLSSLTEEFSRSDTHTGALPALPVDTVDKTVPTNVGGIEAMLYCDLWNSMPQIVD